VKSDFVSRVRVGFFRAGVESLVLNFLTTGTVSESGSHKKQ